MCGLMPTPQPGQIRCPTCHRPTPPAAFCTQCGAAIPASAQPRPRGMDRNELEERIRTRKPGEGGLRRGTPLNEDERPAQSGGYVPFVPEPEDAMAVREEESAEPASNVDNTPPDFDWPTEDATNAAPNAAETRYEPAYRPPAQADAPVAPPAYHEPAEVYERAAGPEDEEPYGAPEDAYPYTYAGGDDGRRRGSSALPIFGFILLAALALGVGAVLASMLGGNGATGQSSSTPSAEASVAVSVEPTVEPTDVPSDQASATPEPTDGPITFPDGAVITVQPCATQEMSFGGCIEDGSVISDPTMWVWIGFEDARGSDTFVLTLRSEGQTIDQQEKVLGSVLDCPGTCTGYLIGAAYRGLEPGDYELIVRRDDDFADAATFTVEG
jgi:hypothetical protein